MAEGNCDAGAPVVIRRTDKPTMPLLKNFPTGNGEHTNIIERISAHHHNFGTLLLNDKNGKIIAAISAAHYNDPNAVTSAILLKWLQGSGRQPYTWDTLIKVLVEIHNNALELAETLNKYCSEAQTPPPSSSLILPCTLSSASISIGSAAYQLKCKRGIAILVTDNDGGKLTTDRDAAEMLVTLEDHLGYKVYQLRNKAATVDAISGLLEEISCELSEYNGPLLNDDHRHKAIIFAFAGHGDRVCINCNKYTTCNHDENCCDKCKRELCKCKGEKEDVMFTNDWKDLHLKGDVVQKLMAPNLPNIPKLFFIDACRGQKTLTKSRPKIRSPQERKVQANTRGWEANEVNYRIDYTTIPGYTAPDPDQWMISIARLLRGESLDGTSDKKDLALSVVMDKVREHVNKHGNVPQVAETVDRLATGPLYLLPKP